MKTRNHNGIAHLAILLIAIIVGLVSFTGWYVWHSKQSADKAQGNSEKASQSTQQTESTATAPDPETKDWYLYTSPGKFYKIKLADGWELTRSSSDAKALISFSNNGITYKKGTKATVTDMPGGRDGPVAFSLYVVGQDGINADNLNNDGEKQTGFKTYQRLSVDKYIYSQTTEQEGIGLPKGGRTFFYIVSKGSTTIRISHDSESGSDQGIDIIEKVVRTLEL